MNERDILNRIIELLEDLQWDYDRMSSCGRKTVLQLEMLASKMKERIDAKVSN